MYKVFLADDEFKVINGMIRSINWESLQSEVIGYAQDGEEAQEKINRLHPDIILIDIRMPKKSGLEVMENIDPDHPCAFIIFSGYTEFEYAKKALQLNAVNYLIKPVNISEIEESVRKAQKHVEHLKISQNPNESKRKEWLSAVLDGKKPKNTFFPGTQYFFLFVLHVQRDLTVKFSEKIQHALSDMAHGTADGIILRNRNEIVVFCAEEGENAARSKFQKFAEILKTWAKELPKQFYWAKSPIFDSTEYIENAYMETVDTVEMYEFFCEQQENKSSIYKGDYFRQKDTILCITKQVMCTVSIAEAEEVISDFFRKAVESDYTPNQIRGLCLELYYSLKFHYQREYPEVLLSEQGQDDYDYFTDSYNLLNVETIKKRILSFYHLVNYQLQMHQSYYQQRIVYTCKAYVDEHLAEPITLATIAEFVNMNPTYLSHTFKKATGINLFDYITEQRVMKAKCLLKTTYMKIFEIAKEVGYPNQRYFCQVFKKKEGITAAEYRNKKCTEDAFIS